MLSRTAGAALLAFALAFPLLAFLALALWSQAVP